VRRDAVNGDKDVADVADQVTEFRGRFLTVRQRFVPAKGRFALFGFQKVKARFARKHHVVFVRLQRHLALQMLQRGAGRCGGGLLGLG